MSAEGRRHPKRAAWRLGSALAGLMAGLLAAAEAPQTVRVPPDLGEGSLPARRSAQLAERDRFGVAHDFGFADRVAESGIRFRHRIVDDAGIDYKPVHYDHGNGLAAADVDGDGRVDLYFLSQLGTNELWKNLGDGRFRDVTAEAGVGLRDRISVAASFADVDNDGDPDLFVTTVRKGNVLFENDGEGRFRDVTRGSGLEYSGHSSGAVFFDFDRDGLLDLFLCNVGVYTTDRTGQGGYYVGVTDAFAGHLEASRAEASVLYRNLGRRRFADVSKEALLVDRGWAGDAAAADFNADGWPDLYVLNMQGDDHYYENVEGRFFVERTAERFPRTPWGTMGIKAFDWNNDGRLDLLLTDMHSDMSEEVGPEREKEKSRMQWSDEFLEGGANNIFGNAFYENMGDGFREISDRIGIETYWPWGVSVGDLNADGWEDVFVTGSMNYPFRYGVNSVLLNDRGQTFRDAEFILGVEPRPEIAQPWFDIDCGTAGRHSHCEGRQGRVTVLAARGSRGSVVFDLDGDGDLDVVTNEFFAAPQVLVSDLAQKRKVHALQVRLTGRASNRDGLGARVTVRQGERQQMRVHDGSSGYLSHSLLPLYFGLGEQADVDRVEVLWPSGRRQIVPGPVAPGWLEIVEEEGSPAGR